MALSELQKEILVKLLLLGVTNVVFFFMFKWLMKSMDPNHEKKQAAAVLVRHHRYTNFFNIKI